MKILIEITPSGCEAFVSKCWGGHARDKKITQESGILKKNSCLGKLYIAARGFAMKADFAMKEGKADSASIHHGNASVVTRGSGSVETDIDESPDPSRESNRQTKGRPYSIRKHSI